MAASDALSEPQFAKHRHPLGGMNGPEAALRWRADYEARNPNYAPQHQMDDGAAMALFNHQGSRQKYVYTPRNQSPSGKAEFGKLWD